MKLPENVERDLQAIESEYDARGGQQAGTPRLRGLRASIEEALRVLIAANEEARIAHDVLSKACTANADAADQSQAEVLRLKEGRFTPEEIHTICHNLHGTVDAEGFADGCAAEQMKLYGCAPDRDRLAVIYGGLDPAWAMIRIDLFDCGPDVKSATRVFGTMVGYVVKLKAKGVAALDVKILEVGYINEPDLWGLRVHPTNDDGDVIKDAMQLSVAFENIESIGIY